MRALAEVLNDGCEGPSRLEARLASAQLERLGDNFQRWLTFSGVATGEWVELQALGVQTSYGDRVRYAHASDIPSLARLLVGAEKSFQAVGLYVVGNIINDAVATRSPAGRWHEAKKGSCTTDRDIVARRVLFIDIDAERPSGTSASDAEIARVVPVAEAIYRRLAAVLGAETLAYAHSGNGRQIYVALDRIAETPELATTVQSILAALDRLHSTGAVKVDRTVGDAKRLMPAFGTVKRKGAPDIPARPHRQTALVCAETVRRVGLEELTRLLEELRKDLPMEAPASRPSARAPSGADSPFGRANDVPPEDVCRWLDLLDADRAVRCPRGHTDGVAILNRGLKCHHKGCSDAGKNGFRSPVDLVAEVRGVEPRDAVNLMAEHFGFEGIAPPVRKLLQQWHAQSTAEARQARSGGDKDKLDWMELLTYGDRGQLRASVHNAALVLAHDPRWRGMLGFDERARRSVFLREPPWDEAYAGRRGSLPRPIVDADDTRASIWLEREYGLSLHPSTANQVLETAAQNAPFEPVRDYLAGLAWDGEERVASWLTRYLGAADSEYTRAVGAAWLISAVARTFEPGCKADHMLVLEGQQGIGKSTALRVLAGAKWFADEVPDLRTKDAAAQVHGPWIVEISELDAMRRNEVSAIKAYVSRAVDRFRPAYGRRTEDFPRRNVFAGTTNDSTYLQDATGNRRFWPVTCGAVGAVDCQALEAERDQLWAEAVELYRQGASWHLKEPALAEHAAAEQEERHQPDAWEGVIATYLLDKSRTTVGELLQSALVIEKGKWTRADQMRVAQALKRIGWTQRRANDLERTRFYVRPGAASEPAAQPYSASEFDDP